MAVEIISDWAADLPLDKVLKDRFNLDPIPQFSIGVEYKGKSYNTRDDLGKEELANDMRGLRRPDKFPTSSAPNPEEIATICEESIRRGLDVLILGVGKGLSSAYDNYQMAVRLFKPGQLTVGDTGMTSMGEGLMAMYAKKLAMDGSSVEQISRAVDDEKKQTLIRALVPNTDFLMESGRIPEFAEGGWLFKQKDKASNIVKKFSDGLSVAPILQIDNNKAKVAKIIRYRQDMTKVFYRWVVNFVDDGNAGFVALMDCDAEKLSNEVEESLIKSGVPEIKIYKGKLGPSAVHGGNGALSVIVKRGNSII
jgi:fatty acid-binding protein DegV